MGEIHDYLLTRFRRFLINKGYKESKSPMPTFRPDIFCQKSTNNGRVYDEVVVEAEIKSTLFNNHTVAQLVIMDKYITQRKKERIKIVGYLIIPNNKEACSFAKSLLDSTFPDRCQIKIKQIR